MYKVLPALLAAFVCFGCNNSAETTTSTTDTSNVTSMTAVNSLSAEEKTDGWQLLFDGQTLNGWHKYGGAPVGSAWKVEDGTLRLQVQQMEGWQIANGGDIVAEPEFENFHLKLEWKIDTGGNSGIMFYVHEDSVKYKWPWETGPEMQVLDNAKHPDAKVPKHRAGDLYDILACTKETVKPALEWNAAEIKCVNGKLDFWLNGENVVSTTMWDDNWKQMLKTTKWATRPDFSTYKKGRIALQDHGNNVWFRNIKAKKL
jgi:hypothetical protein